MHARMRPWLLALALCVCLPATAKKIYKVVDAQGITHYTDRKPDVGVAAEAIAVRAEEQDIAKLRIDGVQRQRRAVVTNYLAGPIEVELTAANAENIAGVPPLPLQRVLEANSERVMSDLQPLDDSLPASFSLSMRAVPGDPAAQPDGTVYRLPFDTPDWRIDQGFGGSFSHNDAQSGHAIDFALAEGTPVVAARAGVVMQVEDDFEGAGLDREKFGSRANHVRIVHSDGTMAVYAHLQPESVMVAAGAHVRTGQKIGNSGNTGFSTGPHLHFSVQVNIGMDLLSIPFALEGPEGPVKIPGQ